MRLVEEWRLLFLDGLSFGTLGGWIVGWGGDLALFVGGGISCGGGGHGSIGVVVKLECERVEARGEGVGGVGEVFRSLFVFL